MIKPVCRHRYHSTRMVSYYHIKSCVRVHLNIDLLRRLPNFRCSRLLRVTRKPLFRQAAPNRLALQNPHRGLGRAAAVRPAKATAASAHRSRANHGSTEPPRGSQSRPEKKTPPGAFRYRSQIEISSPCRIPPLPDPADRRIASHRIGRRSRRSTGRGDGLGAVLLALRRQPLGGGHLRRDGRALRGNLLAPHLPHRHLQLPPRLHRAPLPQARRHEVRRRLLRLLLLLRRRRILLRAARLVAGQEDGPRRDQPQGRRAGALARQAQVGRRRRRRALRRLRPPQLALRGPRRRQAALRARAARPADEPPRAARERPHRLLHGLPLLPLLHEHPNQPPEAAWLRAATRGCCGRRGPLPHARSQSELSCVYHNHGLICEKSESERRNIIVALGRT